MNIKKDIEKRIEWIKEILNKSGSSGIVFGNSGGKDSALVGILSRMATDNVTGIIMPCESKQNYNTDKEHALLIANKYNINTIEIDLTNTKNELRNTYKPFLNHSIPMAINNINPRLRMMTLYTYAQTMGYLVAGTGNLSEITIGYFTKWGDGAYDFNPISDLTVAEVYQMLQELECPQAIIQKAPSAGLYEGQTDENEIGITYDEIDKYIKTGNSSKSEIIEKRKKATAHKRVMPLTYK